MFCISPKFLEYGQLHHIYYNQCPLQADRTLARDFWNQHGPVNGRGQRPNWTSDRMLSDRLSKARADIRRLGGDPQLVVQALAQGPAPASAPPAPAAPAVASPPPPTPAPAPSTAPAVFATPVPAAPVAPVAPAPASAAPAPAQGPIFRPISPGDMKLCPLITNARVCNKLRFFFCFPGLVFPHYATLPVIRVTNSHVFCFNKQTSKFVSTNLLFKLPVHWT